MQRVVSLALLLVLVVPAVVILLGLGIWRMGRQNGWKWVLLIGVGLVLLLSLATFSAFLVSRCGCSTSGFYFRPAWEETRLNLSDLNLSSSALANMTDDTFRLVWSIDSTASPEVRFTISRGPTITAQLNRSDLDLPGHDGLYAQWRQGALSTIQIRFVVRSTNPELSALSLIGENNTLTATYAMSAETGLLSIVNDPRAVAVNSGFSSELDVPIRGGGTMAFRIQDQAVCC